MENSPIYQSSASPSLQPEFPKAEVLSAKSHASDSNLAFPLTTSVFPLPTLRQRQHKFPQQAWKNKEGVAPKRAHHVVNVYHAEIVHPVYENFASDTQEGSFWVDIPGDSCYNGPLWRKRESEWQVFPQYSCEVKGPDQMTSDLWCVIVNFFLDHAL
jgi:hypothetical protein